IEFVAVRPADRDAAAFGEPDDLVQAIVGARGHPQRGDAIGFQRLHDGVDAVDPHGIRDSGFGIRSTATNAAARSRLPTIFRMPAADGNSAPRSMAGTAISSSGPSARPVNTRRIG